VDDERHHETNGSASGRRVRTSAFCLLIVLPLACQREMPSVSDSSATSASTTAEVDTAARSNAMTLKVTSSAFQQGGSIPSQYTCEGKDISPPIAWSGAPSGGKTIAMIVDDPDAPDPAKPQRVYVHWVVYNIPVATGSLPENASKKGMPKGAVQGKNDWGRPEFGGPCPPIGRHRYFFKLYALDTELNGLSAPTKADLEQAMKGHVLDSGELMGTYQKAKK
jgi:Raf kinase inhibitor-like YbhB/YbcL family protein